MGQLWWRCRDVSGTTVDMADKAYKAKEGEVSSPAWNFAFALRSPLYQASWSCWKLYTCL